MLKQFMQTIFITFLFLAQSCATIIGEKSQQYAIHSEPEEAIITITDERGIVVEEGKSPINVTLKKSDGSYFGGKTYNVEVSHNGYQPFSFPLITSPNASYILGNIVFGGLIGWLIVDPATGAMYDLSPSKDFQYLLTSDGQIKVKLVPKTNQNLSFHQTSLFQQY